VKSGEQGGCYDLYPEEIRSGCRRTLKESEDPETEASRNERALTYMEKSGIYMALLNESAWNLNGLERLFAPQFIAP